MGMGIPIVVSMPAGEATEIIREARAGVIVKPEDPAELAAAVAALFDDPSKRKRLSQQASVAAQLYSRESMAYKMLDSFHNLIR